MDQNVLGEPLEICSCDPNTGWYRDGKCRTDGNIWTIIKKNNESIRDIIPVKITDAQGVTLFGENIKS